MKKFFSYIFNTTMNGFLFIIKTLCDGFYTYLIFIMRFFNKIFKNKFDKPINSLYRRERPETIFLIIIYVFTFTTIFNLFYTPKTEMVNNNDLAKEEVVVDDGGSNSKVEKKEVKDSYSYWSFAKYKFSDIDFDKLTKVNKDAVAWISVDGTNINYPVVQTSDNDYYLNHSFTRAYSNFGWVFMDFRNDPMNDNNTIFYGHNLVNKASFGSVSNIFTNKWFKSSNHSIVVLTNDKKYKYKIFSIYYSKPVVDYLQVDFYGDSEYTTWLNKLVKKSKKDFKVDVSKDDKIITLSTCTDDNKGRKVVHAKLVSVEDR